MSGQTKVEKMVTVRALQPVVGTYPASPELADHMSTYLAEDENGNLVTKRRGYRKFVMQAAAQSRASPDDLAEDQMRMARGEMSRVSLDGEHIIKPATEMELPETYVTQARLVERGLVQLIDAPKPRKAAA